MQRGIPLLQIVRGRRDGWIIGRRLARRNGLLGFEDLRFDLVPFLLLFVRQPLPFGRSRLCGTAFGALGFSFFCLSSRLRGFPLGIVGKPLGVAHSIECQ